MFCIKLTIIFKCNSWFNIKKSEYWTNNNANNIFYWHCCRVVDTKLRDLKNWNDLYIQSTITYRKHIHSRIHDWTYHWIRIVSIIGIQSKKPDHAKYPETCNEYQLSFIRSTFFGSTYTYTKQKEFQWPHGRRLWKWI